MSYDSTSNDAKTIADLGMCLSEPNTPQDNSGGIPYVVIPKDAKIQDLESLLDAPTRIREQVKLHDPASFIEYVKRFKQPGTTLFFDQERGSFKAVMDYHVGNAADPSEGTNTVQVIPQAQWCDHVATFTARLTPQWQAWLAANGKQMRQAEFAKFIEDRIDDVGGEYGRVLLQIALTLEIKKDVWFTNHQRQEDGSVKLQYEEDVKGSASAGQITIPSSFQLQIQPYVGGPIYIMQCRLRYRLQDRAALLWFEIAQLQIVIEKALDRMRDEIREATGIAPLAGE